MLYMPVILLVLMVKFKTIGLVNSKLELRFWM
jgi:hypothetical protein